MGLFAKLLLDEVADGYDVETQVLGKDEGQLAQLGSRGTDDEDLLSYREMKLKSLLSGSCNRWIRNWMGSSGRLTMRALSKSSKMW